MRKMSKEIKYKPIGIIHTPFKEPRGTPIQPRATKGAKGFIEVFDEFSKGLKDLEGFSHIILIYHFHLSKKHVLVVSPFLV
jgi:tRNA (Thr-GGU) A37 N-methylase